MMQAKHRSRRLRKKLRVGEFQEFGFGVSFQLRPELPKEELENFWDAFILSYRAERARLRRWDGWIFLAAPRLRYGRTPGHLEPTGRLPKIIFAQHPCPCKPRRARLRWCYAGVADIIVTIGACRSAAGTCQLNNNYDR